MENKLYTETELKQYLNRGKSTMQKRQGVDRMIKMCQQAGLIIAPVQETLQGKGKEVLYRIVEDNYNIPNEIWVNTYCSSEHEVSNLGRIRQKESKRLMGSKMSNGYITIGIGQTQNLRAHRVVYFSFHPELLPEEKSYIIDHINGKRDDNRLENLRAISNIANIKEGKQNQKNCQSILAQLLLKYGYEETQKKLLQLLDDQQNTLPL